MPLRFPLDRVEIGLGVKAGRVQQHCAIPVCLCATLRGPGGCRDVAHASGPYELSSAVV